MLIEQTVRLLVTEVRKLECNVIANNVLNLKKKSLQNSYTLKITLKRFVLIKNIAADVVAYRVYEKVERMLIVPYFNLIMESEPSQAFRLIEWRNEENSIYQYHCFIRNIDVMALEYCKELEEIICVSVNRTEIMLNPDISTFQTIPFDILLFNHQ